MSLDDELKTRNLYRFGSALQRVITPEQGPIEPTDYSAWDYLDDTEGVDDLVFVKTPEPFVLPKETFDELFGTVNGRVRLGDGYMAMNQLSASVESVVKRTYTDEEVALIMIGANMVIAAFVDEAQTSALSDQFPDIS